MEQCVICFENLIDQEIGTPEHCEHTFCFPCLVQWTKQQNSCPVDRQNFQFILKKHSIFRRKPYAKVNINTQIETYLQDDFIPCHACDNDEQEYDPLLTCTQCNKSYHEFCLNSFDTSLWMCPSCGFNNEERKEEVVNNPPVSRRARTRIITFGLRDQGRTLHTARPCRSSQQKVPQNLNQRIGNVINSNTLSPSTAIQIREKHSNSRSVITPHEAARRIAVSGIPIQSSSRSTALISQARNMATLKRKRKRVARLPPRILIHQLPRIQRRTDAPLPPRSKTITPKRNRSVGTSFIDQLLHSQKQLYSLENFQTQGAQIKVS